jgi:hypothetical protein
MTSDTGAVRRPRVATFILFVVLGMLLYLGLLSTQYDLNGVTEAAAVEQGGPSLFSPNHMLYRPLVWLIYALWRAFGYSGLALLPAQVTTALFGAAGLGLFYWWVRKLVENEIVAAIASLGFGTSWAYWVFSTDAFYIVPAATMILGALILLSTVFTAPELPRPAMFFIGLGILCALAILLWQANIFFLPVALVGLWVRYKKQKRSLLTAIILFGATVSIVIGCVYLFVGIFISGHWTISDYLDWLLHYGAPLPMWGRWDIARLANVVESSISSLIPLWEGLGLKTLLKGEFRPDKFLLQLSLVSLALLFVLPVIKQLRELPPPAYRVHLLGWTLLGYAAYLPFILWWDPFEPKWFVIPNIQVWAMLAVLWDSTTRHIRHVVLFASLILTVSIASFSATIWPHHVGPSVLLQRAECVASHMDERDLFVTIEWNWSGYINYFFRRQVFSLINASASPDGKNAALNLFRDNISLVHQRGGKVYMVDIDTCSLEQLNWLASQTGLTQKDFQQYEYAPAFTCDVVGFEELERVR